ncbi:MAG: TMEM165/GDT1 family protein [Candidatus Muiribacteriota bacterium]
MFDFSIMFSTFFLVFLAELGDKTQLAVLSVSGSKPESWFSVFIGSAVALILTSFIAVFAGKYIGNYVPAIYVNKAAGIFFILMGFYLMLKKA